MAFILCRSSVRAVHAAAVQLLPLAPLFWALLLTSRHFPPCLSACGFGCYYFFGVIVLGVFSCGWVRISSCHLRPSFRLCCYLPLGALLIVV